MIARSLTLRTYQVEGNNAIRAEYIAGKRSTLLVMATGLGKTVSFVDVARRVVDKGGRVLILAHRQELIDQPEEKLLGIGVAVGVEKADRRAGDAKVVVASIQTLRGKRLEQWPHDYFKLIIIDEAHHAIADGYRAVVDRFSTARVLGVTATPDRTDGNALGDIFQSVAYRFEMRDGIRAGWLAPIRARRVKVNDVDLGNVSTRAGDLAANELANEMMSEKALHGVAKPLVDLCGDRLTIVFAASVAHAKALAETINLYRPEAARSIDGTVDKVRRKALVKAFVASEFKILVNCALFTEGFDCPAVSCVAIARPTKSRALYTQMVGRGTRLSEGKTDCLLLDFVGNSGRHRLVGPADCLLGSRKTTISDEERDQLDQLFADGVDFEEAIETVKAEVVRRRERAVVDWTSQEIDPFLGSLNLSQSNGRAATEAQIAVLERNGFKLPETATCVQASQIIQAIVDRREQGLCSPKQARFLRKRGVDPVNVSFSDAGRMIENIMRRYA